MHLSHHLHKELPAPRARGKGMTEEVRNSRRGRRGVACGKHTEEDLINPECCSGKTRNTKRSNRRMTRSKRNSRKIGRTLKEPTSGEERKGRKKSFGRGLQEQAETRGCTVLPSRILNTSRSGSRGVCIRGNNNLAGKDQTRPGQKRKH